MRNEGEEIKGNPNQINFETDRLIIEEITLDDLENIHLLHSIPEVDEFNTLGIPKDIKETKKLIEPLLEGKSEFPRGSYEWKIIEKNSKTFIGLAGMVLSNDKFRLGEIYYKLHPKFWGQGYATEVAKRLVSLGFDDFNHT